MRKLDRGFSQDLSRHGKDIEYRLLSGESQYRPAEAGRTPPSGAQTFC